jgi:hypothetical protein
MNRHQTARQFLRIALLVFGISFIFYTTVLAVKSYRAELFNTDSGLAQTDPCGLTTNNSNLVSISNPNGYSFSMGCLASGSEMYLAENRYTFSQIPTSLGTIPYIKTPNVSAKNDPDLAWNITISRASQVFLLTRKIPNIQSSLPNWATGYTRISADSTTDLGTFLLRRRSDNKSGVYDIWRSNSNTITGRVNFGTASDDVIGENAYSMYIVAVKPQSSAPTSAPTSVPTNPPNPTSPPTQAPGRSRVVQLATQNNSGQSGTATITELGSQTRVVLSLSGGTFPNPQPAHIHSGTCLNPGGIIYGLTNVTGGQSTTLVNATYDQVNAAFGILNIHKSVAESGVYTACGPASAATAAPTAVPGGSNLITSGVTYNSDSTATISRTQSSSVRVPQNLINPTQGWIAGRIKIGFASNTNLSPDPIIFDMSETDPRDHFIYYDIDSDTFHFARNNNAGGNTLASTSTPAFSAGTAKTIVVAWTASEIKISVDGGQFATRANSSIPAQSAFYIGSTAVQGSGRQPNSDYYWVAAGTGVLTNTDAGAIHGVGNTDRTRTTFPVTTTFLWDATSNQYNK